MRDAPPLHPGLLLFARAKRSNQEKARPGAHEIPLALAFSAPKLARQYFHVLRARRPCVATRPASLASQGRPSVACPFAASRLTPAAPLSGLPAENAKARACPTGSQVKGTTLRVAVVLILHPLWRARDSQTERWRARRGAAGSGASRAVQGCTVVRPLGREGRSPGGRRAIGGVLSFGDFSLCCAGCANVAGAGDRQGMAGGRATPGAVAGRRRSDHEQRKVTRPRFGNRNY